MNNIKLNILMGVVVGLLSGCVGLKPNIEKKEELCFFIDPSDYPLGEEIPHDPPPPLTGIEREESIVLMTRKEFNERIKLSPLWESLYDKELDYGSYGPRYSFKTLGNLIGSNGKIYVESRLDGHYWKESQRITKLSYGSAISSIRNQYQHQLLEQERVEMIETLKLAINDIDDETAAKIIDDLYKQYMVKVNSKEYLADEQTIHTYIKYDGKIIAFWGEAGCKYDMFKGMTID